jgi:hypothetical protein
MSYSQNNGYTPVDFNTIMSAVREGINTQFNTEFTVESFVGTGWYKYAYAIVQKVQENEIKTSEIFAKLQEYFTITNEQIQRPSVSNPGIIEAFQSEGFVTAVKKPIEADAGKIAICVDTDDTDPDYPAVRLQICTLIMTFVAAGIVSTGTEVESIALSNGQSFDFKFDLPDVIPVKFRLTLKKSANTTLSVPSDEAIRGVLFDNFNTRYRLGYDLEPQRYFTSTTDAPWASQITLEWTDDDGLNWYTTVFEAIYTDLFTLDLEDIEVIIT